MELAEVEFTARLNSVVDRAEVIRSALGAAGVAESSMREFAEATEVIVHKESAWKPDAVVTLGEGKRMNDGAPYAAQRGSDSVDAVGICRASRAGHFGVYL